MGHGLIQYYEYGNVGWWKVYWGLSWTEFASCVGLSHSTLIRRANQDFQTKAPKLGAQERVGVFLDMLATNSGLGRVYETRTEDHRLRWYLKDPPDHFPMYRLASDDTRLARPKGLISLMGGDEVASEIALRAEERLMRRLEREHRLHALKQAARKLQAARRKAEQKVARKTAKTSAATPDPNAKTYGPPKPTRRVVSPWFLNWLKREYPESWRDQLRTPGALWVAPEEEAYGVFTYRV